MKAVYINRYGGNDVITLNLNTNEPTPKKGQILVNVRAASLNLVDRSVRNGALGNAASFPVTLGGDFAGIVADVGTGVTQFSVGDEVYGSATVANAGSGSFAECTAANAANTARKPRTLDFAQSAALPLVGASAVQALEEHMRLQPGQSILIHGGVGGIGSIAIQLAKYLGAHVITTVRNGDGIIARELGADEVINYQTHDFTKVVYDLDAVLDTVGGEITNQSLRVLRPGGMLVTMTGEPNESLARSLRINTVHQRTKTTTEHLSRLAELVDHGAIKPQIDRVFPLEQTRDAFEYFDTNHHKGKVIIQIK